MREVRSYSVRRASSDKWWTLQRWRVYAAPFVMTHSARACRVKYAADLPVRCLPRGPSVPHHCARASIGTSFVLTARLGGIWLVSEPPPQKKRYDGFFVGIQNSRWMTEVQQWPNNWLLHKIIGLLQPSPESCINIRISLKLPSKAYGIFCLKGSSVEKKWIALKIKFHVNFSMKKNYTRIPQIWYHETLKAACIDAAFGEIPCALDTSLTTFDAQETFKPICFYILYM